jgi:hypothetical protein
MWGQITFDMKLKSKERKENLEPIECEKGKLLGDD